MSIDEILEKLRQDGYGAVKDTDGESIIVWRFDGVRWIGSRVVLCDDFGELRWFCSRCDVNLKLNIYQVSTRDIACAANEV